MGLAEVPVSSGLLAVYTVGPMLVSFLETSHRFTLRIDPHIVQWHQYYRLVTNSLIWTDQVNVLLSALTLYRLRVIEQFFGSRRFGKLVLSASTVSTALTGLAAWGLYALFNVNLMFQPNATGLTAALLAWYAQLVPAVYYVRIGHATVSDKFLTYVMFTLLLQDWGDVVKAVSGLAAKAIVSQLI